MRIGVSGQCRRAAVLTQIMDVPIRIVFYPKRQ